MDLEEERIREDYEPMREGGETRVSYSRKKAGVDKMTPAEIATFNLRKVLKKYPEFEKNAREDIINEFFNFPHLPYMNLDTFALVLIFLNQLPRRGTEEIVQPTKRDFEDKNILEYINRILPTRKLTEEERRNLILRLKADFLRYSTAIIDYRTRRAEF